LSLRRDLDRLVRAYGPDSLPGDPLSRVRRYADPRDREVAGLVASGLAFGSAVRACRSADAVLGALGSRPADRLRRGRAPALNGFRHRWVAGADVERMLRVVGQVLAEHGSVEAFYLAGGARGVRAGLTSFSRRVKARAAAFGPTTRGFRYLFPEPEGGSAAKRLCLFLRWMVRPDDGLDLGVWSGVSPADLIVPLDTHVLRIARYVGLTDRRTASWTTAEEITAALRRLRPDDPVRYDYALARLGISRDCVHRRDPPRCGRCPLDGLCRL